jgi:hypothetical protein
METAFKLVVVFPFGKYRRGEVIYDQNIVNAIFDKNNLEMHQLKKNVRRVPCQLSDLKKLVMEKTQEEAALNAPEINEPITPPEENLEVHLSTVSNVNEPEEDTLLPKSKRLHKPLKGD